MRVSTRKIANPAPIAIIDPMNSNAVAVAISLVKEPREFWFHFADAQIGPADKRRPVRELENLVTGERHLLEWNGLRIKMDPSSDPAILFRCHV